MHRDTRYHPAETGRKPSTVKLSQIRELVKDPAYGLIAVSLLLFASSYLFDAILERTGPSTPILIFLLAYAFALIALWLWMLYRVLKRYFL